MHGRVFDADTNATLPGLRVTLQGEAFSSTASTDQDGAYTFEVPAGPIDLFVATACYGPSSWHVDINATLEFDLHVPLIGAESVGTPMDVRVTPGPGTGMATVSWAAVQDATQYRLWGNGTPLLLLGNSLAYSLPGAKSTDAFQVTAVHACGVEGAPSRSVSPDIDSDLGDLIPLEPQSPAEGVVNVSLHQYPVHDADGVQTGMRLWRTVEGIGNCCENYLAVTPNGRILDLGSSPLYFSDDAGLTWKYVMAPTVVAYGEGAVVPAPDGDVVAFSWETYTANTVNVYRYSAVADQWYWHPVTNIADADRPWIGTIKGPFEVEGVVLPFVTHVWTCSSDYMSLDGLTYTPMSPHIQTDETVDLRTLDVAPDGNRDWIFPAGGFPLVPVDNGAGFLTDIQNCNANFDPDVAMQDAVVWKKALLSDHTYPVGYPPFPIVRIDSAGNIHTLQHEDLTSSFSYEWSHDGGRSWGSIPVSIPGTFYNLELVANAGLDQAIVAAEVLEPDGYRDFRVYRFRGLSETPYLDEVLDVGVGGLIDYTGEVTSFVTSPSMRFDFMTAGLLPSGKIVLSFGDMEHTRGGANPYPAVAIER